MNASEASASDTSKRLTFFEKMTYGSGSAAEVVMSNIIFWMAFPIYESGLGIKASLIGLAIGLPRLWDAVSDPLMGNISDNYKGRIGRRKPFIFLGSVMTGLLCMLLWMPPVGLSKNLIFSYFTIISFFYFAAYTVFFVSYNALGFELTRDYDERTSVMSYKTFFANVGAITLLPMSLKMCMWFGDTMVDGARIVGVICGVAIILFGITPALFCKERVVVQEKITFREALSETLKNKPFLNVAGITVFMAVGYSIAIPLLYYINMAYLFPGDENQASSWMMYLSWAYSVVGFMCVPVVYLLSKKIGKCATLVVGLSMVLIGTLASWFYYTPKAPWLQFFYAMTFSPGLTCAWVILPSMISDICDTDELKTERRREGVYGAVFTFVLKLGVSLTMMVSGVIITWTGYNRECAIQTEDTIMKIRAAFAFLPIGFLLAAIILALKYPVTRQNIIAIQKKLNCHRTDSIRKKECVSDE